MCCAGCFAIHLRGGCRCTVCDNHPQPLFCNAKVAPVSCQPGQEATRASRVPSLSRGIGPDDPQLQGQPGSYNWTGMHSNSGFWMNPAFQLHLAYIC